MTSVNKVGLTYKIKTLSPHRASNSLAFSFLNHGSALASYIRDCLSLSQKNT